MIPTMLVSSDLPNRQRYEVWHTPNSATRYMVLYLVGGVEVSKHRYQTEIAARKNFERLVEEKS